MKILRLFNIIFLQWFFIRLCKHEGLQGNGWYIKGFVRLFTSGGHNEDYIGRPRFLFLIYDKTKNT